MHQPRPQSFSPSAFGFREMVSHKVEVLFDGDMKTRTVSDKDIALAPGEEFAVGDLVPVKWKGTRYNAIVKKIIELASFARTGLLTQWMQSGLAHRLITMESRRLVVCAMANSSSFLSSGYSFRTVTFEHAALTSARSSKGIGP